MLFVLADAFGGLRHHGQDDSHRENRDAYAAAGEMITVVTTSLMDLLQEEGGTEGDRRSEHRYRWQRTGDSGRDRLGPVQVPLHDGGAQLHGRREAIAELLRAKGYERQEPSGMIGM